jgi:hypothetical protein
MWNKLKSWLFPKESDFVYTPLVVKEPERKVVVVKKAAAKKSPAKKKAPSKKSPAKKTVKKTTKKK